MAKALVRRIHLDEVEWQAPKGGALGVKVKVLNLDPEIGAGTRIMSLPPGWRKSDRGACYHECAEEVFVLGGDIILDDTYTYTQGCYLYRPAGIVHGEIERTENGCLLLSMTDGKMDWNLPESFPGGKYLGEYAVREIKDGRGHVGFLDTGKMEWEDLVGAYRSKSGLMQKVLSVDKATGASTILVKIPAGFRGVGTHFHECLEEFYIIDGSVIFDNNIVYKAGCYACHPPRVVHGHGECSEEGAISLMKRDGFFRLIRPEDVSEEERRGLIWE